MDIIIREDKELVDFAVLEFKGQFEPEEQADKQLMSLGQLHKIDENNYKLEIGVMDVVGVAQKLKQPIAVFETIPSGDTQRILLVKGYVKMRILFDKRPVPIM